MLYEFVYVKPLEKFVFIGNGICNLQEDDFIKVYQHEFGFIIVPKTWDYFFSQSSSDKYLKFKAFGSNFMYTINFN